MTCLATRAAVVLALIASACAGSPSARRSPEVGQAAENQRCSVDPEQNADGYEPWVDLDSCLTGGLRDVAAVVDTALLSEINGGTYAELFAPDAEPRIFGRTAEDERFDRRLTPAQIIALVVHYNSSADDSFRAGFPSIEVERIGDTATVRATRLDVFGSGEDASTHALEAQLRRAENGWRLVRLRSWPLSWVTQDEGRDYGAAYWGEMDAAVHRAHQRVMATPTVDARRQWVEALLSALRFQEAEEALAPQLVEQPDVDALEASARIHLALGRVEAGQAARASIPTAPIRALVSYMRREMSTFMREDWCPSLVDDEEEEPSEDDEDARCEFEVLSDVRVGSGDLDGVGLVRIVEGFEAQESTYLVLSEGRAWFRAQRVSEGPFIGNQTDGVERIAFSDVAVAQVAGENEFRARFERTRLVSGDRFDERGVVLCSLGRAGRCAFLVERIAEDTDQGEALVTLYEVHVSETGASVRRTSGPAHAAVPEGAFSRETLYAAP